MSTKTRHSLAWLAIGMCTAMTIGAIATAGTDASAWFAVGTWIMAITVAFLSRRGRTPRDTQDAPTSQA